MHKVGERNPLAIRSILHTGSETHTHTLSPSLSNLGLQEHYLPKEQLILIKCKERKHNRGVLSDSAIHLYHTPPHHPVPSAFALKYRLFVNWLQMCTLCQSQLWLSQGLSRVMGRKWKTPNCSLADLWLFTFTSQEQPVPPSLSAFDKSLTAYIQNCTQDAHTHRCKKLSLSVVQASGEPNFVYHQVHEQVVNMVHSLMGLTLMFVWINS